MQENDNAEGNSENGDKNNNRASPRAVWTIAAVGVVGVLVIGFVAIVLTNMTERIKFFTTNALSVLLLDVIVVQAYIYSRQWEVMKTQERFLEKQASAFESQVIVMQGQLTAMRDQAKSMRSQVGIVNETLLQNKTLLDIESAKSNPRLRVSKVRIENFEVGKEPVFIVTIANGGLIDATGVRLHIAIQMDVDKELNWIDDPIVTIPASGTESYPIVFHSRLEQRHIDGFNGSVPLKVIGHFTYWPIGRKGFCFRYLPWDGQRPDDISQFVSCEFEPRLNIGLKVEGGRFKLTGHAVTVIHGKAPEETRPDNPDTEEKQDEKAN